MIKTSVWRQQRLNQAISNCLCFKTNTTISPINCAMVPGFDGRLLNDTYKRHFIQNNYISPSFPKWDNKGKVGAVIAAVNVWKYAYSLFEQNKHLKYVLIIEDDTVINDKINFITNLTEYIRKVTYYGYYPWDYIQIGLRENKRKDNFIWLSLVNVAGNIYQWKKSYFTMTKAGIYTRNCVEKLIENLPVDRPQDKYIGTCNLNIYTVFPPLISGAHDIGSEIIENNKWVS